MPYIFKQFDEDWAYDLNKNLVNGKELLNEEVIHQSIESIIGTIAGERLFNRSFGTGLFLYLFESLTERTGEKILTDIINSIKKWENRIVVNESQCSMEILPDEHAIIITIPYTIVRSGQTDIYKKKIIQ